jgi:hypothetical protein
LLTTNETVYEKIAPGHSADFKTKEFAPKGADSVAIKIIGAGLIEQPEFITIKKTKVPEL